MSNLLPLEYCKLDRAAKLLECEVDDLIHLGAIGAIELSVYLTEPAKCQIRDVPNDPSCDPLITNPVMINNGMANYAGITHDDDETNCFCGGIWSLSRRAIECLECSKDGQFAISADVLSTSDNRGRFIVWVMFEDDLNINPSSLWITKKYIKTIKEYLNKDEIPNVYNNPELAKKAKEQEQRGQSNKPHHRSESTAVKREQILAAAIYVKDHDAELCGNTITGWANAILEKAGLFWSDTKEPPLSHAKVINIISEARSSGKPAIKD